MALYIPITLSGDNLTRRHRHLNALVIEAYQQGAPFQEIQDLPEITPVDRLFKIDLASKLRNVDYILQNIKDEDMLYVSRALKAKWLLEGKYQDFINPKYLEENLYPYMVTTAVSKFKNWLYLYLKDSQRCEGFYQFYSEINFDYAMKFLGHCSADFIMTIAPNILENLSPFRFKILCENCPRVAKVYFDNILVNDHLKIKFLDKEQEFFKSLKVVLKLDPDIFFEITEKYFDHMYSRSLTKYIMTKHKDRFNKKPELYAGMLLNMQALAECLSSEECKELVLKLARAAYISYSMDYKFVEPLIKRLPLNERASFKKLVFVEKTIGEQIETWPYEKPSLPSRQDYDIHVFEDRERPPYRRRKTTKRIMKKKCKELEMPDCMVFKEIRCRTLLNKLFDEYRFHSFERTLFELRKRIKEESSSRNRQFMLLVLVSKSGGQPGLVASLLQLLEQHSNEPVNVRAAVVRSLVTRAAVWRLPQHSWEAMIEFARGLGLDGSPTEADCRVGLHAVVIRSLLEKGECEPAIRDAFLTEFSDLEEYSTNSKERNVIREKLPQLLLAAVDAESSPLKQAELLTSLFDMLQTYKVNIESSLLIPALAALEKRDSSAAENLLMNLFNAKIARRTLFRECFPFIQTDASYLNALRYDTSVLNVSTFVDLVENDEIRPEQFCRKLAIYFAECSGMAERYSIEMKKRVITNTSITKSIARPLCILQGASYDYLESLDVTNKDVIRLVAAIRANMHVGRPKLDINEKPLPTIGAKAIANKVLVCPIVKVDRYIYELLTWNRTVRIALVLAERTGKEGDVYNTAATIRPTAILKAALNYIRRRNEREYEPQVWEIFQNLIIHFDVSTPKHSHVFNSLIKLEKIPPKIKPQYCTILFKVLEKVHYDDAISILNYMEKLLSDINEDFLESILSDFLQEFDYEGCDKYNKPTSLYVRLLVKCLQLCKSEEEQKNRFKTIGEPFLQFLTLFLSKLGTEDFEYIFEEVLSSLQYNKVCFDATYVSPLPIIEKIISWMRQYLPVELNFNIYVRIHLTMLYFKSVRLSMNSNPDIFNNEKRKLTEGIAVVGHIFGKKIAREIKQLSESYFESAIDLYSNAIACYFNEFQYDVTKYKFITAVLQGMLEGSSGDEVRTALYVLQNYRSYLDPEDVNDLFNTMKNIVDEKFQYFLFAELLDL